MKVALAQLSYIPGDISFNKGKILAALMKHGPGR
jgi:hypothetical protein